MGLDYSYKLYFRRAQLRDALAALTRYAEPHNPALQVQFPDQILSLPFDKWGSREVHWNDAEMDFPLVLNFEPDDALVDYIIRRDKDDILRGPPEDNEENDEKISIGYIYLTVTTDLSKRYPDRQPPELVLFDFGTTGTQMSLLFSDSSSIRNTFCEFLEDVPGVCGVFDREMGEGELFWLQGKRLSGEIPDSYTLPDEILDLF
jgi:hypothetical protein